MKTDSCHTADSKPVKQEVNSTVILPPLVFPALVYAASLLRTFVNYGLKKFYKTGSWALVTKKKVL